MYTFKNHEQTLRRNVKILHELFVKMVVPIAIYNSAVWGNILLHPIVEKLQNRIFKYILGIRNQQIGL